MIDKFPLERDDVVFKGGGIEKLGLMEVGLARNDEPLPMMIPLEELISTELPMGADEEAGIEENGPDSEELAASEEDEAVPQVNTFEMLDMISMLSVEAKGVYTL